jgi:putative zinc finger/helix-turn-helix YgiT family protein
VPSCGDRRLKPGEQRVERAVGPLEFEGLVQGWACDGCGEVFYDGADLEEFERQIARWIARHGFTSGEEIRFMRKVAGIRAVDLAKLLGVSAETVSHWETGKHEADRAARSTIAALALEALDDEVSVAELLRALEKPDSTKRVKLPRAA